MRNFRRKDFWTIFSESVNQHNKLPGDDSNFFLTEATTHPNYCATPPTANSVKEWLSNTFSGKFLHKRIWPPRSPDLNPCDYYVSGHLKSMTYNPFFYLTNN